MVIVIAGATATGKTDLAESLAGRLQGEVVCADARQVFRELDIGTGKPSRRVRASRPHHLFDWRSLGEGTSAGAWARAAAERCVLGWEAGAIPILVGGSGLYLRALIDGLHGEPGRDEGVRSRLEAEVEAGGLAPLRERLRQTDPVTGERLSAGDRQRIVRALEVFEVTGRRLSEWNADPRKPILTADFRVLELTASVASLAGRIESRTRWMFENGLLDETRAIRSSGGEEALRRLRAIGYDEAMALQDGRLDEVAARAATDLRTRQLAKRQRTWFRHQLQAERLDTDAVPAGEWLELALRMLRLEPGV